MPIFSQNSDWKDKALFTPGPLTTSRTVKQAMLRDLGSRDAAFIELVRDVRSRLVALGGVTEEDYTAVLMQGSGTFGIEAVISSTIPPEGKLLVLVNGHYGERMLKIARVLRIPVLALNYPEDQIPDPADVEKVLREDAAVTHVAVVHCETTTGIINPIQTIGEIVRRHKRLYFVDAMSSFGAYPIQLAESGIDYLVSSANKDIEGVPGFSFVLARKESLAATQSYARSLSLDLYAQWQGLERDGQFRFTPPTHAILAFHQALLELEAEGGVEARAARYRRNYETTASGMQALGFKTYLRAERQGYVITSFYYPLHPNFSFSIFYEYLSAKGYVIYPGKLSHADCFRIGHIGRLESSDVNGLLLAVRQTLAEMGIVLEEHAGIKE
jgi:2-aminoethylphosphonate-pyruvate transaminase